MPFYVTDPDSPGKHVDVIELQRRNPYKALEPYFIKGILKRDVWERREALLILAGFNPCGTVWPDKAMTPNRITYLDGTTEHQLSGAGITHPLLSENLAAYYTLSGYAKGRPYDENKTPEQWLSWAKEKGFTPYWLDYAKANQSAPTTKGEAGTKQQRQRQRQDALAVELDEILSRIKTRTPAKVMAMLREKIGKPNTCVLRNVGDGIEWENDRGDVKTLTISNLGGRIREWKKTGLSQG